MIERDWTTKSGLRAICYIVKDTGSERRRHRCGYVEVPAGHPLHGVDYSEPTRLIPVDKVEGVTLGAKSPLLCISAGARAFDGESIRRSPDVAFDAHGGLTYSGSGYPVASDGWWFGFDCAHSGDAQIDPDDRWPSGGVVRSEEYVVDECERLAAQISEMFPDTKEQP
jgi:hypothetical protein